jgi:hypothetical protein
MGATTLRMNKAVEIQPLLAGFHDPNGTAPPFRPDFADDGKQSGSMFIEGPEFHDRSRMRRFDLGDELRQGFF